MNISTARRPVTLSAAVLAISAFAFLIQLGQAPRAEAEAVGFCNVNLPANYYCASGEHYMYQDYGWGESGSVCVRVAPAGEACSGGPNQGVYSPQLPGTYYTTAFISNHRGSAQVVHGVFLN